MTKSPSRFAASAKTLASTGSSRRAGPSQASCLDPGPVLAFSGLLDTPVEHSPAPVHVLSHQPSERCDRPVPQQHRTQRVRQQGKPLGLARARRAAASAAPPQQGAHDLAAVQENVWVPPAVFLPVPMGRRGLPLERRPRPTRAAGFSRTTISTLPPSPVNARSVTSRDSPKPCNGQEQVSQLHPPTCHSPMPSRQRSRRETERNLSYRRPFRYETPLHRNADGESADGGTPGCILRIFTPEVLDSASLVGESAQPA